MKNKKLCYTKNNITAQDNKSSANGNEPIYPMMKNQIALKFMNAQSFTDDVPAAHIVWMRQVKPDRRTDQNDDDHGRRG